MRAPTSPADDSPSRVLPYPGRAASPSASEISTFRWISYVNSDSESRRDIFISVDNSFEPGLTRTPVIEQAMEWLVDNGPLVAGPPLPSWALERLVKGERILRLRRDVYLAPTREGRLPSIEAVVGMLAPTGYITAYAAMILHGLTDQDTNRYVVFGGPRQSDARYGHRDIRFLWRAAPRVARAHTESRRYDDIPVNVATVAQAVADSLVLPQYAPTVRELVRVIRVGLQSGRLDTNELIALVLHEGFKSVALARRAGFLLSAAGGGVDHRLADAARRSHDRTALMPGTPAKAYSADWHLELPLPDTELVAAGVEL